MTQLINLYRQAENYFFRGISLKYMDLGGDAQAYMTGVPIAGLNLVYVTKNTNALDKVLSQSKQFYDQDNLSFVVIVPQEFCTPTAINTLDAMGYAQIGASVSMALELNKLITDERVTTFSDQTIINLNDGQLNDWMLPLIGAFESTAEVTSVYAATHKAALKKGH